MICMTCGKYINGDRELARELGLCECTHKSRVWQVALYRDWNRVGVAGPFRSREDALRFDIRGLGHHADRGVVEELVLEKID